MILIKNHLNHRLSSKGSELRRPGACPRSQAIHSHCFKRSQEHSASPPGQPKISLYSCCCSPDLVFTEQGLHAWEENLRPADEIHPTGADLIDSCIVLHRQPLLVVCQKALVFSHRRLKRSASQCPMSSHYTHGKSIGGKLV